MKKIAFFTLVLVLLVGIVLFLNFKSTKTEQQTSLTNKYQTTSGRVPISKGEIPKIPFQVPEGYVVHIFTQGLSSPRDLQFSPGGTLLVSDPAASTITALPDKDNDGVADTNKVVVSGGSRVHGLAFYDDKLFVAEVDKVESFRWNEANLSADSKKILFSLPPNSNHNNRTIVFNSKGIMFISVGSTCNVCHESATTGGSVFVSDQNGRKPVVFASGLRNAAFLAINPMTDTLWGTEMGRDNLGDNIPPDEINVIRTGRNYGWPNCYGDEVPDKSFNKKANCTNTTSPIFEIPAHSAPLGLTFIDSAQFPASWQGDLLVALHGSWNRSTAIGYKIIHLKVNGETISNSDDFMTGFNPGRHQNDSLGRPADVAFDKKGNLYISDDKAGVIYIVQKGK